jgi:glyoxylase-like metal-dependent hydrolase (beta-lactamase superfamily II)/rhodanese-related sulfurtransferase
MPKHTSFLLLFFISLNIATSVTSSFAKETPPPPAPLPLVADTFLEKANKNITNIDTKALYALLENDKNTVLIDIRTQQEIDDLGGAIKHPQHFHIPRGWLEFRIADAVKDKNTPIVVYCGKNLRSPLATQTLMNMGYTQVKNYQDGYSAWKKANFPIKATDEAPLSLLYSKPTEVIPGVWSAIGETSPGSYRNSGHNNNLSFIITDEGVLVVNAGDNYLLAKALHHEIKQITDKPVKYVVLENGQGHAMLGSNYWREQGVPILAHVETAAEIKKYGHEVLSRMQAREKDKALATEVIMPDKTFGDKEVITLGGLTIELLHLGPSHSPGDIMVWLPEKSLIITGDMAFHQRLLPIFEHTNTKKWLETWEKFAALKAKHIIPGHGHATTMEEVTQYTKDYLLHLRTAVAKILEDGGELQDVYNIDQSAYSHLDTFGFLANRNAEHVFREMEFE